MLRKLAWEDVPGRGESSSFVSAEVSLELGYGTEESFTQAGGFQIDREIPVPPGASLAVWSVRDLFILRRSDGSEVAQWNRPAGVWFDLYPDPE